MVRTLTGILMLLVMAGAPTAAQTATPTAQAAPSGASVLHVRVVNLRNSIGQVICTLFNSPQAFPTDSTGAIGQIAVPIKDNAAVCSFSGLASGKYALVAFHDENSNGKFDRNWFGLPKKATHSPTTSGRCFHRRPSRPRPSTTRAAINGWRW